MTILPVLSVATIHALLRLQHRIPRRAQKILGVFLLAVITANIVLTWLGVYAHPLEKLSRERIAALKILQTTIPTEASLSAMLFVSSHFAHRQDLYLFPAGLDKSDYVLVDTCQQWGLTPKEQNELKKLQTTKRYKLILKKGGFLLFRREMLLAQNKTKAPLSGSWPMKER